MKSSGELMKLMNNAMKQSVVAKTMMNLSKEMFKAGVIDEMVSDAMDNSLEDVEEETEEEVDKVLAELAVESVAAMPAPAVTRTAPAQQQRQAAQPQPVQEIEEEEDGMGNLQARLDAIRAA
jgi:charged multivesicular body protein 3